MVLRQLRADSGDEHSRHVMDSVRQAKLAVQMDILDGRSWCECSQKIDLSIQRIHGKGPVGAGDCGESPEKERCREDDSLILCMAQHES